MFYVDSQEEPWGVMQNFLHFINFCMTKGKYFPFIRVYTITEVCLFTNNAFFFQKIQTLPTTTLTRMQSLRLWHSLRQLNSIYYITVESYSNSIRR